MPYFTEKSLVEDYLMNKLVEKGWTFKAAEDLERDNYEEPLLIPELIRCLNKLNAEKGIGPEEVNQVINELKLKSTGPEAAKQLLNYLKNGVPIKFEKDRLLKYVRLFDYNQLENNKFVVTRQPHHVSGDNKIINDIILYVNGIPLVNIECKNPASFSENWYSAYKQIKEYEREVPELYKYVQIGVAAEQTAQYFPIVPWQEDVRHYEWKGEDKDPLNALMEMLQPATLLKIIRDYLFYRVEFGSFTKVLPRYMQYRSVEKICQRVLDHVGNKSEKNRGLIWHWQGSGKTLEMIYAANKLYLAREMENPTIFIIVDREDLEEQLGTEFTALDITQPERIYSIDALRKVLKHDEGKGKKGIFITLIHKFRPEELTELQKELEASPDLTILKRKNVVGFVDEGHRSQYGTLAAQMRAILKNASFFAFTGTPISKPEYGRDTYESFSYLPEEKYLDRYFITEAIDDGNTVKIAYKPRLDEDLNLKKDLLDTFLEVEYEEIPEEARGTVEEKVKRKLNAVNVYLENKERIRRVAEDIAKDFKANVDGKFKAMVVAVSRKACVEYKRQLDALLPPEYSEVVMTFNREDPKDIQDYLNDLRKRYAGKEIEDIRKDVVDKFKEEDYPKILIVTDMLLTGFDAPILQTMYLDKPLKEHRLLQAIARTNRPYKDLKEAGLIIDYVGILKDVVKAFEMYSKEDVKGVLVNFDELRANFTRLIQETLSMFEGVPKDRYDHETMQAILHMLTSKEENSKKFEGNYKQLRRIFELLGPDEVKLKLFSKYKWISAVYTYYSIYVLRKKPEDYRYVSQYFEKTLKYVYKSTEVEQLEKDLPIIEFDSNYLRNLEAKVKGRKEKAANIVFTLNKFILTDKGRTPISGSLSERVERIIKMWKAKSEDDKLIYEEGIKAIEEYEKLKARQRSLGFNDFEYSELLILEDKFGKDEEIVSDIQKLSSKIKPMMFRGWSTQPSVSKDVEKEIRRFLRRIYSRKGLDLGDIDEIHKKILESAKQNG